MKNDKLNGVDWSMPSHSHPTIADSRMTGYQNSDLLVAIHQLKLVVNVYFSAVQALTTGFNWWRSGGHSIFIPIISKQEFGNEK